MSGFRKLIAVNGYIFIRTIFLMTALSLVMRVAGALGEVEMAASHVVMQYMLLISLGLDGFAHATEALAGSAWGKGNATVFRRWVKLTGIWALASDVTTALYERVQPQKTSHIAPPNPIWNFYKTADGRWLAMVMPMATPYWPKFCDMVERQDWATDERYQTLLGLAEHGPALVPEIEQMFAAHDLAYWREKLDGAGLIWEPVAELPEVVEDPALRERGAFSVVVHERSGAMEIVSAPFHIRGADIEVRGPAPDLGEHTRDAFIEAGIEAVRVDALISKGTLR